MGVKGSFLFFKKHYIASALILSISIISILPNRSFAFQQKEHIEFEKFSSENGLASNDVWAVIQDYKGLIWIGTENGLNLFDGYSFILYEHDNLDTSSLGYNHVTNLFEDSENNLWICTNGGGLNLYNREQENFYVFRHVDGDSTSISGNCINSIFQDSEGTFWVGTVGDGACTFRYDKHQNPISIKFTKPSAINNAFDPSLPLTITSVTEDQYKNKWIGTDTQGILILNNDGSWRTIRHDSADENSLASDHVYNLYRDSKDRIWIATWDSGLDLYHPVSNAFIHYTNTRDPSSISNNQIWSIKESNNNELWIGTDIGLNRLENPFDTIPENRFIRYIHNDRDEESLESNVIQNIYFDSRDRLWVSTLYGGMHIWDKHKQKFQAIHHENDNPNSLTNDIVTSFVEDSKGNIWIGMDGGGLNFCNKSQGDILDNNFHKHVHNPNSNNTLSSNKVLSISMDSKDGLWIGTWSSGLNYLDTKTKEVKHFYNKPNDHNSLSSNDIPAVTVDEHDNIWIATYKSGLNHYNPKTRIFTRYLHDPDDPKSLSNDRIYSLKVDKDNGIWIGTNGGGLNYFDMKTKTFKHYLNPDSADFRQFVNTLHLDATGELWVSFYGHGILKLDRGQDQLTAVDIEGIKNLVVKGILDDGENLWLSTINGLIYYKKNSKDAIHFYSSDGIQGNQFRRSAVYRTSGNTLLFGGINGLNAIDPYNIVFNQEPPPIIFTDITINDQPVSIGLESPLKKHISETNHISLKYNQNAFSISFAALDYTLPENNQYTYILEGFQDEWIMLHHEHKVAFTNLDEGKYTFKVKASNNDGFWNEQGINLSIEIYPPWWKTIWFRLLFSIAIIMAAYTVLKLRTRYLERQKNELRRTIAKRTKEINTINTELTERLEEISLQNTVLNEQKDEITQQKNEIYDQNNQLATYNEELTAQNEHVYSQNEKINEQNKSLEKFKLEITSINENLEIKVKERTEKLNETISELNKTVAELDRFVYSASHDLSSPLKSIQGLVHIANLENKDERINEYLGYIESSIHKLEDVIKNLVQFSRNNRIEIKAKKIMLNSFVSEVIKELRFMPEAKKLVIKNNIPVDFLVINDYQRLKVVIHNLIGNAIKYADPEKTTKRILISTKSDEKEWELTIADNGIGIDKDNLKRIFNMFFRATEKSTGSGLGLFIVHETVERLNAKINVTSSLREGSTFTLSFKH